MNDENPSRADSDEAFRERLAAAGQAALRGMAAMEAVQRALDPAAAPRLRDAVRPLAERARSRATALRDGDAPGGLEELRDALATGAERVRDALEGFVDAERAPEPVPAVLESFRQHCRAQECLYPLRQVFPPLARYFAEPAFHDRLDRLDEEKGGLRVGLHRAPDDEQGRGGLTLYVPESADASAPMPLVVALHGGFGHGADFVWTWLREARGRRFLLLAPTSKDLTWSLDAPGVDAARLRSMLDFVAERWPVDRERILLTGLSDGATFALLAGMLEDAPYTALAPVSGVLHPLHFALGNAERAAGRRIYLVHGARDWMFPVAMARMARDELVAAGADVVYREIEDLSHTYPRDENDAILTWFDPTLALPDASA